MERRVGPIPVRQPWVRHRDKGRFCSAILPKAKFLTRNVQNLNFRVFDQRPSLRARTQPSQTAGAVAGR